MTHPNYRTGKSHDGNGYVTFSSGPHRGRREHRVVAEQMLGRPLRLGEVVHHRNHDKADNRPENLEVIERAAHQRIHLGKGQTLACRVCGTERWYNPTQLAKVNAKGYACRPCGGRWAP